MRKDKNSYVLESAKIPFTHGRNQNHSSIFRGFQFPCFCQLPSKKWLQFREVILVFGFSFGPKRGLGVFLGLKFNYCNQSILGNSNNPSRILKKNEGIHIRWSKTPAWSRSGNPITTVISGKKTRLFLNHAFAWVTPAIFVIVVFSGAEERSPCFQWVDCRFVIFAVFVKTARCWQGTNGLPKPRFVPPRRQLGFGSLCRMWVGEWFAFHAPVGMWQVCEFSSRARPRACHGFPRNSWLAPPSPQCCNQD